tara:strand:+ start:1652 stop:3172 length:1521 start_codon:yes stop_codon:yes gene_type:complete
MQNIGDKVSIKIQIGLYSTFRHLNNKPWFALSEFVDNAVQSYLDNKTELNKLHEGKFQLEVRIKFDKDYDHISIEDNAGGISTEKYLTAFEPANIPLDTKGLHEFGMGMKTAAVWLSDIWKVKTKALGEIEEREIEFNLDKVIEEQKEDLNIIRTPKRKEEHYTEIIMSKLSHNTPSSSNAGQVPKIKSHLSSIYRKFIRTGELKLYWNGQLMSYSNPKILEAPYYKDKNGSNIKWKKDINFSWNKYSASGFIGILETMSTNQNNGFSLFRRGRVILGSHDEKYRPKELCGQIGSPRYKRIFGELELNGFGVSFNKGSFTETEDLEAFMGILKAEISDGDLDIYNQAEKYIKPRDKDHDVNIAEKLVKALKKEKKRVVTIPKDNNKDIESEKLEKAQSIVGNTETIMIGNTEYILKYELISEDTYNTLYSIEQHEDNGDVKNISFKVNLGHDFFIQFEDSFKKQSDYQPILSIIKSLIIAEYEAQDEGTENGSRIRINFNRFLNNL